MRIDSAHALRRWLPLLLLLMVLGWRQADAQQVSLAQSHFLVTSDGVRLHYLEAGPRRARTIVLVPGWTMPAWIWGPQISAFSRSYRVIAFDPRGQGESEVAISGYEPTRRGQDIAELIAAVGDQPVVLVGWSLGVLDALAYIHDHGDARVAGLVLVDNSVGEEPASRPHPRRGRQPPREEFTRAFVRGMFRKPQSEIYLETLADAMLRTPDYASAALLAYPVPRSYWRATVYATTKPVLYAVRPAFAEQALNLERYRPGTEIAVFADAGHALFIDDAVRFNRLMQDFIQRKIWP